MTLLQQKDVSEPGETPEVQTVPLLDKPLPYSRQTVGMSRYWAAMQNSTKITRLIKIPAAVNPESIDEAEIDGKTYQVVQVQEVTDEWPAALLLSLKALNGDDSG